jgi:outer membrane protein assembly factor BamA
MEPAGLATWRRLVGLLCTFAIRRAFSTLLLLVALIPLAVQVHGQAQYEEKTISEVSVTFEGLDKNVTANESYRILARDALGPTYTAIKVREAIEKLYNTKEIASVIVEASDAPNGWVRVRFIVRRKTQAQRVTIQLPDDDDSKVTEQELLFRLNILDPGTAITEQTLQNNADVILEYLRDRGFFKAEVSYSQHPLDSETEVGVTFRVVPNAQATVSTFNINIVGFDNAKAYRQGKA